jgi:hypothetical protein
MKNYDNVSVENRKRYYMWDPCYICTLHVEVIGMQEGIMHENVKLFMHAIIKIMSCGLLKYPLLEASLFAL